jgi:hypothetical protein
MRKEAREKLKPTLLFSTTQTAIVDKSTAITTGDEKIALGVVFEDTKKY